VKNEKRCRLLKATTGFFYHRRNTRALSFPLFFVPRARALSSSLSRALCSLSLPLSLAMPPKSRLPLPVRPDVYPLLGALALATAGALSFSFFTLRKTVQERSELQKEGKMGER
jgi:hypothetical protein